MSTTSALIIHSLKVAKDRNSATVHAVWGDREFNGIIRKPAGLNNFWLMIVASASVYFKKDGTPVSGKPNKIPPSYLKPSAVKMLNDLDWEKVQ